MFKNKDQFIAYTAANILASDKNTTPESATEKALSLYSVLTGAGIYPGNQQPGQSFIEELVDDVTNSKPKG